MGAWRKRGVLKEVLQDTHSTKGTVDERDVKSGGDGGRAGPTEAEEESNGLMKRKAGAAAAASPAIFIVSGPSLTGRPPALGPMRAGG